MALRLLRQFSRQPSVVRCFSSSAGDVWNLPPALSQRFSADELSTMKQRFEGLRTPGSNAVTVQDLHRLSQQRGAALDEATALTYIKEADKDGDGVVSWQDFSQMMLDMKTGENIARLARLCFPEQSLWDDENVDELVQNNREWVARMKQQDPEYFAKLRKGQQPRYLFIGCADSRVPAQELMGMKAGQMFVHRNVANLVVNSDLNLLSVLAYAVEVLHVKDIIVCGHTDCGGVRAGSTPKDHGLVEHWIRNVRDVARLHAKELAGITDPEEFHMRMVELNVQEQCMNLLANPIVQRRQAAHGLPRVHGFVYNVGEGLVRRLDIDFRTKIQELRRAYDTGYLSKPFGQ